MGKRSLAEIAEYHDDVERALRLHYSEASPGFAARFFGFRHEDIEAKLSERLEETNRRSAFFVLASMERAFRADYEYRCRKKLKDNISRAYRKMYKKQKKRVRLERDIFETWRETAGEDRAVREIIGELRGAFWFRHRVAHGEMAKPTGKYDYDSIYSLAENALSALPLLDSD